MCDNKLSKRKRSYAMIKRAMNKGIANPLEYHKLNKEYKARVKRIKEGKRKYE